MLGKARDTTSNGGTLGEVHTQCNFLAIQVPQYPELNDGQSPDMTGSMTHDACDTLITIRLFNEA